jgi:hypothetical protein
VGRSDFEPSTTYGARTVLVGTSKTGDRIHLILPLFSSFFFFIFIFEGV